MADQVEIDQTQHFLSSLTKSSNEEQSKFFEVGLVSKRKKLITLLAISLVKLDKQLIDYWSDEAFKEGITGRNSGIRFCCNDTGRDSYLV